MTTTHPCRHCDTSPVNHGMDRRLAEQADAAWPGFHLLAHAHRAFVQRAVAWLTRAGIGQFLDIGSGLPILGAVHEHTHPDARVVYVDIDPQVVAVAGHLLADQLNVGVIHGDLRGPGGMFDDTALIGLLNFAEPVAVLLTGVMHHLPESDMPSAIMAEIRDCVADGSYVVVSHLVPVSELQLEQERLQRLHDHTPFPLHYRTPRLIARNMIRCWTPIEPGIVPVTDWHPDHDPGHDERLPAHAGLVGTVARAR